MEKIYLSRSCIKAWWLKTSLLAAVYKRYIPKSKEKTFNITTYVRQCGEHREEMQFSANYS